MYTLLKPLQVREKLLEKGIRTFTPRDFERLFNTSPSRTKYFLESKTDEGLFARLKQGVYVLKTDLPSEEEIANSLYRPSYISFEYALAYYGLIPEMPYTITSATTKPTREFVANNLSFAYYTIKQQAYTGYMLVKTNRSISANGNKFHLSETGLSSNGKGSFLIAEPEKALVDTLYFVALGKRELNDRIDEKDTLDKAKICKYAALYNREKVDAINTGIPMIAGDALQRLSRKYQTPELNVRREYVQHLFLAYFYQQPEAASIYFKGGTALRIVYGSPRFSEDLDFDATQHDVRAIEGAVLHALVDIEHEGIPSKITESKKTTGGYLAIIEFELGERVVPIRLEVSFRGRTARGDTETVVGDFVPPYLITVLTQEDLVNGKLAALLDRKKPRDFYDLYFLLQKGFIAPQQKTILREVLPLIQSTNINFTQELKQFLPQSHWAVIKDFKTVLERAVGRYV